MHRELLLMMRCLVIKKLGLTIVTSLIMSPVKCVVLMLLLLTFGILLISMTSCRRFRIAGFARISLLLIVSLLSSLLFPLSFLVIFTFVTVLLVLCLFTRFLVLLTTINF
ncbi:MAG: hypothetical protein [Microviridae sp.]|nr:MAG: hypothetical protein [Microviridae sp.]